MDRTFRRSVSRNSDLNSRFVSARATGSNTVCSALTNQGGTMTVRWLMDFADYGDMIERSPIDTWLIEYRDADGTLIGVMLTDRQDDGLSAVYSFFDTDASSRSLGTFMVLDLIKRAAQAWLSYVYLGYWIKQSRRCPIRPNSGPVKSWSMETGVIWPPSIWSAWTQSVDTRFRHLPWSDTLCVGYGRRPKK